MIYRIHDADQKVVMDQEDVNPVIESGLRYLIEITKLRNRAVPDKVDVMSVDNARGGQIRRSSIPLRL